MNELEAFDIGDCAITDNGTGTGTESIDEIFSDIRNLRIPQDYDEQIGLEKHLLFIPVRKPAKEWFFRVNDDPEMQGQFYICELKEEDREKYLVLPHIVPLVEDS